MTTNVYDIPLKTTHAGHTSPAGLFVQFLIPSQVILDADCAQYVECVGIDLFRFMPVPKDPNHICHEDELPELFCAKGFVMNSDGVTCDSKKSFYTHMYVLYK